MGKFAIIADLGQYRYLFATTLPEPHIMSIAISKESRKEAIASIERYFRENMDDPISGLAAESLLDFFLEDIGPVVYNRAVADVQEKLQQRVMEVDIEVHEEAFAYWHKRDSKRRKS
jgi:uncharacterized protein (DUF2164 family)